MAEKLLLETEQILQDVEVLLKKNVFDEDECRKLIRNQNQLYGKVNSKRYSESDLLGYLQFHINYLLLLDLRMQRFKTMPNYYQGIQTKQIHRIVHLFTIFYNKFGFQNDICLRNCKFLYQMNKFDLLKELLMSMIAKNLTNEDLWVTCAQYAVLVFEEMFVHKLFIKALQMFPQSKTLAQQFFDFFHNKYLQEKSAQLVTTTTQSTEDSSLSETDQNNGDFDNNNSNNSTKVNPTTGDRAGEDDALSTKYLTILQSIGANYSDLLSKDQLDQLNVL